MLSAGLGDLQFSSDWSALGVFTTGSISDSWTTSGNEGWWSQTVSFGRTFATAPLAFFEFDVGGGKFVAIGNSSGFQMSFFDGAPPTQKTFWIVVQATTTGINFYARYNKQQDAWTQPHFTVRYTVMYYNL